MKLAKFTRHLKPSETLAISAKAKALRAQGREVIDFSVGEPDFNTPDNVIKAAEHAMAEGFTKYTQASGLPALRQAIADKLERENALHYEPDQIIVSCGAKHVLYNLAMVLVDPGDEVIVPGPYWVTYPTQVEMAGGVPVIIPTTAEEGFKITGAMLRRHLTPATKGIILNSPCNPTGAVYTPEELQDLAEVLRDTGLYVITDEIYEHMVYDGLRQISIATLSPELKERCIVVNGVSKSFSMTGWRVGYCAGPADVIAACGHLQSQSTSNPTAFAQMGAIEALTGPQESGTRWPLPSQSGGISWSTALMQSTASPVQCLRAPSTPSEISDLFGRRANGRTLSGSADVVDYLLDEAGVAAVPGDAFGANDHMRLSYAASMEALHSGLDRVDQAVRNLT